MDTSIRLFIAFKLFCSKYPGRRARVRPIHVRIVIKLQILYLTRLGSLCRDNNFFTLKTMNSRPRRTPVDCAGYINIRIAWAGRADGVICHPESIPHILIVCHRQRMRRTGAAVLLLAVLYKMGRGRHYRRELRHCKPCPIRRALIVRVVLVILHQVCACIQVAKPVCVSIQVKLQTAARRFPASIEIFIMYPYIAEISNPGEIRQRDPDAAVCLLIPFQHAGRNHFGRRAQNCPVHIRIIIQLQILNLTCLHSLRGNHNFLTFKTVDRRPCAAPVNHAGQINIRICRAGRADGAVCHPEPIPDFTVIFRSQCMRRIRTAVLLYSIPD